MTPAHTPPGSASYRRDLESGRLPVGFLSRLTPRRVIVFALAGFGVLGYLWVSGSLDADTWPDWPIISGSLAPHRTDAPKEHPYTVDEYGDHFLYDYPQGIPSFDPDLSTLYKPDELFKQINLKTHFHLPQANAYPDAQMKDIYNPPRHPTPEPIKNPVPADSYAKTWKPPGGWDEGKKEMPQVQASKFRGDKTETRKRREAVRRGFAHAWQAYKDYAWGSFLLPYVDSMDRRIPSRSSNEAPRGREATVWLDKRRGGGNTGRRSTTAGRTRRRRQHGEDGRRQIWDWILPVREMRNIMACAERGGEGRDPDSRVGGKDE